MAAGLPWADPGGRGGYSRRDGGTWDGFNGFRQAFPPLVDDAISWMDAHLPAAKTSRSLIIPETYIFALWIDVGGHDRILLVSPSDRYELLAARAAVNAVRSVDRSGGEVPDAFKC
ncbi:MAG: hypothetical protein JWO15_149 [Sphingomonadales bacterium]|nr:hypothetical protein [Sphingomonadales bacterium]